MSGAHHLALSLSRELWNEIFATALPFRVAEGELDLSGGLRAAVARLQVRERVAGLLEDDRTPQQLVRLADAAQRLWDDRRADVWRRLDEFVAVQGTWSVEVDRVGSQLNYGPQKVAADAWVKGVAEGRITFLRENLVLPFRIERRVGASVALGRIRYARDQQAVIGNIQDLALHLGDHAVLQSLARLLEHALSQQVESQPPLPVIKREQVEQIVGGLGGALRMGMGVDDLQLDINDRDMTLKVRFGFTRLETDRQLADAEG
jgi:hypothetical protein